MSQQPGSEETRTEEASLVEKPPGRVGVGVEDSGYFGDPERSCDPPPLHVISRSCLGPEEEQLSNPGHWPFYMMSQESHRSKSLDFSSMDPLPEFLPQTPAEPIR